MYAHASDWFFSFLSHMLLLVVFLYSVPIICSYILSIRDSRPRNSPSANQIIAVLKSYLISRNHFSSFAVGFSGCVFSWFSPCTCNDRQIFTMPVRQDVLRLPRQMCSWGTVVVVTRLSRWTRNSCCSCSGRQVCNCIRIRNREPEQRGQKMRKTSCSSTGMCDDLSTWLRGVQLNQ